MTKEEKAAYDKERYVKNRKKILAERREYRANSKVKIREYEAKNKDKKREYMREYVNTRYKTDPAFRAVSIVRARGREIHKTVGKVKTRHTSSFEKHFGCSEATYLAHISAQFRDGMTWENQGTVWELDHVIPLAVVQDMPLEDLESNILMLNHITNLQPLFKAENRAKGDTIPSSFPPNFPFFEHFLHLFEVAA